MTAEEAVRYLEEIFEKEPTSDHCAGNALEAIEEALTLAYKVLKTAEWESWDGLMEYCVFCNMPKHSGHSALCPRQLALASIKEENNEI